MSDMTPTGDHEQMRRWMANWRIVNEAQDELVRTAQAQDPTACLETGLSLIDFALRGREGRPTLARTDASDVESVSRTWRRLRAAYGR
jgi:hypothetical protein